MKKARRWTGPKGSAPRASGLGCAASLISVLVRLRLDGAGGLIGNAQRHLGDALVGVDHLLQGVPSQIALNRDEVLHRAGARKPVQALNVLLQTVLNEAE